MTKTDTSTDHTMRWMHGDHGHCESVPDIWLAGICIQHDMSAEDALDYWRLQSEMGCSR